MTLKIEYKDGKARYIHDVSRHITQSYSSKDRWIGYSKCSQTIKRVLYITDDIKRVVAVHFMIKDGTTRYVTLYEGI